MKPGFFQNEELSALPAMHRLCFAGLWLIADKAGRLEDRPRRIKGELFMYENADVETMLADLATGGFIHRYCVGGERFIQIKNFAKHQRPHKAEPVSKIPACGESQLECVESPYDDVESPYDDVESPYDDVESLEWHKEKEKKGIQRKERENWELGTGNGERRTENGERRTENGEKYVSSEVNSEPVSDTPLARSLQNGSPSSPPVLAFPTVGANGTTWQLSEAQVAEWAALFPNLDVLSESRKALAWVTAHRDRRKTAKGMERFLVGWLSRAVDRGAMTTSSRPTTTGSSKTAGNDAALAAFVARHQGKPS